jgi:SanA protein
MTRKDSKAREAQDTAHPAIQKRRRIRRLLVTIIIVIAFFSLTACFLVMALNLLVQDGVRKFIVFPENAPRSQAAIVLGAFVNPDGSLCGMLQDRVITAVELYRKGKVIKLLMTGDHGDKSYDEVNNMRIYAERMGVPTEDIFMDHAGFNTYESMYRARQVFKVESAIIVTQGFHLERALYNARKKGINAYGVAADRAAYRHVECNQLREIPARAKDFILSNITKPLPTFLGEAIPIGGDGRATHDDPGHTERKKDGGGQL